MATGHYVKTITHEGNDYLLMGDDVRKDQSYFLWRVPQATLRRCLFPLGTMEKAEVRRVLAERGFEWRAKQAESMEVCFVEADYRDFLREQLPTLADEVAGGFFVDGAGRRLGQHLGVPFYTVGQRKGLGIALGKPAYVLRLNAEKNTIVLGDETELLTQAFFAEDAQFVDETEVFSAADLMVRVRYHSQPVPCRIERLDDGRLLLRTETPVSAITPGQSAVLYIGSRLVGGVIIGNQRGIGAYLVCSEQH
jgi:tRNA-specific 2-thiouridylase